MATLYPSLLLPIAIFSLLFTLTPWLSGWGSLAEKYRAEGNFSGPTRSFWYAHFRSMTKYNRALKVGMDGRGLSLATALYFRPGHPPLFIPWTDIQFTRRQMKIFSFEWAVVRIFFKGCPDVYLDLTQEVLTQTPWTQYAREITPGEAPEVQKGKEILRMVLFVFLILGLMVVYFHFLIPRLR